MRHFYLIVSLIFLVFSHQVAAELKVGFVNAIRVMNEAPQVESANHNLEREFASRQRGLVSAKQAIKTLEERFTKNADIMIEAKARKLSRKIRDKGRELKRQREEFREDYNFRRNEELDKIQKIITQVIQTLAKRESYDLILSDGVVWASKRIDITDKVLRQLRQFRQ
ncbi:MAG: OmpH family outer membrane protein [Gammaproteobacteria bacterium]|nr:MAG: OmpH family outer membrane protein [Gammaproteobacteria bacterium]RKZ74372.1 MAG: OmpH family outer membrane protein [Gammaproteobacteria bacterium]